MLHGTAFEWKTLINSRMEGKFQYFSGRNRMNKNWCRQLRHGAKQISPEYKKAINLVELSTYLGVAVQRHYTTCFICQCCHVQPYSSTLFFSFFSLSLSKNRTFRRWQQHDKNEDERQQPFQNVFHCTGINLNSKWQNFQQSLATDGKTIEWTIKSKHKEKPDRKKTMNTKNKTKNK